MQEQFQFVIKFYQNATFGIYYGLNPMSVFSFIKKSPGLSFLKIYNIDITIKLLAKFYLKIKAKNNTGVYIIMCINQIF